MRRTQILSFSVGVLFLISCGTASKFQASTTEDKPLYAAINELVKRPENAKAQADIKLFYDQAVDRHQQNIAAYTNSSDPIRWDKTLKELNALQYMYTSISATPGAAVLLKPKNYVSEIQEVKELAAEDHYAYGLDLLSRPGRQNSLQAYQAFKASDTYINGYKDSEKLISEAYEKSIINIVVNPIEENSLFFSSYNNWQNDFRYRPEDYQSSLVRELSGRTAQAAAVRFYTDREARMQDLEPDWMVDINWRGIDPIRSAPHQYSRNVSRKIQVGTDTSGKAVFRTVNATLYITQNSFVVRGDLDYRVRDLVNNSNVDFGTITDQVSWTDSYATYSGDSRALDQQDWLMINNRSLNNSPGRGDILNTLMRKMYPDIRRRIESAVY